MNISAYLAVIGKQWKFIMVCFLAVGLGAFIISKLQTPLYQATAIVQVGTRPSVQQARGEASGVSEQLVQTQAQLAVSDAVLSEVASRYKDIPLEVLASRTRVVVQANTQLFTLIVKDTTPTRAATLANDIVDTLLKRQIELTRQSNHQVRIRIQQNLADTQQQIDEVAARSATLQAQEKTTGELVTLQTRLKGLQQHYDQLQSMLTRLEMVEMQSDILLQSAQHAQPNYNEVQPDILFTTVIGLLVGLVLGILCAFVLEKLDIRVYTPETLFQLLQWPVLVTIWRVRTNNRRNLVNLAGHESGAETYRTLLANIRFSGVDRSLRTIAVTSAVPGEGKSVVAANLAIALARTGKRTLLIDANLQRPVVHMLFDVAPEKMGLSNAVLAASVPRNGQRTRSRFLTPTIVGHTAGLPNVATFTFENYVHEVGVPNLHVMPSGPLPPNPADLYDSNAMQRFLKALEFCGFEVIIFDMSSVQGLYDATTLASKVDGTLLVIDTCRAGKRQLRQMKTHLSLAGVHVLGCVLNKQRAGRPAAARAEKKRQGPRITNDKPVKEPIAVNAPMRFQLLGTKSSGRLTLTDEWKESRRRVLKT